MSGKRRRVVFLSATAGTGHLAAAEALAAAAAYTDPKTVIYNLDTFKYTSPFLEKLILGTYMEMLRVTPAVYGYLYKHSEKGNMFSGVIKTEFNRLLGKFSAARLVDYIKYCCPDIVVCTHPFALGMLASLKACGEFEYYLAGIVTDFAIHPYWLFPEVDFYSLPAAELVGEMIECGIRPERIHVTGIPISPSFCEKVERKSVLSGCTLDYKAPTVLISGGGLGLGPVFESVRALNSLNEKFQMIVVSGRNDQLKERIDVLAARNRGRICSLGYVKNMSELLAASDLMIGKAGGLSCAEAVARGLPIFIVDPLPGQEERNTSFLVKAGVAVQLAGTTDLVCRIREVLHQPTRLKTMAAAAKKLGRPDAARECMRLMHLDCDQAAGVINSPEKGNHG